MLCEFSGSRSIFYVPFFIYFLYSLVFDFFFLGGVFIVGVEWLDFVVVVF